jgi:membrane protein implicated in regulation of membrane protease activity
MNLREAIGLLLIIMALVLVPVAWAFSRLLWALAFFLLLAGAMLFYTERVRKREEKIEKESGGASCHGTGAAMPTDIHNYTGWRSGGRSETMDSSSGSGGAEGD